MHQQVSEQPAQSCGFNYLSLTSLFLGQICLVDRSLIQLSQLSKPKWLGVWVKEVAVEKMVTSVIVCDVLSEGREYYTSNIRLVQMSREIVIKITDGLFVGTFQASRDQTHLALNKVELILSFSEVRPYFSHYGIRYESVENSTRKQLRLAKLVEQTLQQGGSVLIYDQEIGLPLRMAGIYLMLRYKWSLFKTLQFLNSRIPSCDFSEAVDSLREHENFLLDSEAKLSYSWKDRPKDSSELTIQNTFLNSQNSFLSCTATSKAKKNTRKRRITWKVMKPSQVSVSKDKSNTGSKLRQEIMDRVKGLIRQQQPVKQSPLLRKYQSSHTLKTCQTVNSQENALQKENNNLLNFENSGSTKSRLRKTHSSVLRPLSQLG